MDKIAQKTPKRLVLASSSLSRRQQMMRLGIPFACEAPAIDETPLANEPPEALVHRLTLAKAAAIACNYQAGLIISGDQTASFDGRFIHKPGTRQNAIEQLRSLQGQQLEFISGLCVQDVASGKIVYRAAHCQVQFRQLSQRQIETYVDLDEPFYCAGSFKCEAAGIGLFEYIKSDDPSAITGMPLITLVSLLAEHGVQLFNEKS